MFSIVTMEFHRKGLYSQLPCIDPMDSSCNRKDKDYSKLESMNSINEIIQIFFLRYLGVYVYHNKSYVK